MLRVIKLIIRSTQLSVITVTLDMSDRSLSLANQVLSSNILQRHPAQSCSSQF